MIIHLDAKAPFSLKSAITSHGWIQLAPFSLLPGENSLSYTDRLQSGNVFNLVIEEEGNGVAVDTAIPVSPSEQVEIAQKITWMLGLDQDFHEFYAITDLEPRLVNARRLGQGRVLRCATLFEDTVKTILTTNTVWGSTRRMVERLVRECGSPTPAEPALQAFPTPQQIASSDADFLRSVIRLGYRAPYVYELASRVAADDFDLEELKSSHLNTEDLHKQLLKIKGVGKYAAANLLMLLGRYDFIPVDSWALKMVSTEYHAGGPVTAVDVYSAFERFGKWAGLAFWLWDWKSNEN